MAYSVKTSAPMSLFPSVHRKMQQNDESMYGNNNNNNMGSPVVEARSPKALSAIMANSSNSQNAQIANNNYNNYNKVGYVSPMQLHTTNNDAMTSPYDQGANSSSSFATMSPRDTMLRTPSPMDDMENDNMAMMNKPSYPSLFARWTDGGYGGGYLDDDYYQTRQYIDPRDVEIHQEAEEPEAMDEDMEDVEDDYDYDCLISDDDVDLDAPELDDEQPPGLEEDYDDNVPGLVYERAKQEPAAQEPQYWQPSQEPVKQEQPPQVEEDEEPVPELDDDNVDDDRDDDFEDIEGEDETLEPAYATAKPASKRKQSKSHHQAQTSTPHPTGPGPHKCTLKMANGGSCGKVFSRPYDLVRHQDTIHAAVRKTFKCDMCGDASKTFSRMDALSRHVRVKHGAK